MSPPIRLQPGPCSSFEKPAIPSDHTYRFLIHDRDSIFSAEVNDELGAFGLKIRRTPVQAPKANAYCERLIGSMRRACLDWLPAERKASAENSAGMGCALPSRTPACQSGSGNSRAGY